MLQYEGFALGTGFPSVGSARAWLKSGAERVADQMPGLTALPGFPMVLQHPVALSTYTLSFGSPELHTWKQCCICPAVFMSFQFLAKM